MAVSESGTTLYDWSVFKQDGEVKGKVKESTIFAPGIVGTSMQINGWSDAYVIVPDYVKSSKQLTVCAWIYAKSRPMWATIAKNWRNKKKGQFHFGLHMDSGDLEVQIQSASGEQVDIRENIALPLNKWHHVAFVHDGQTVKLFRNGKIVGQKSVDGLMQHSPVKTLALGTKLPDKGNISEGVLNKNRMHSWHGRLDEIAIFNKALSDQDILTLFEAVQRDSKK